MSLRALTSAAGVGEAPVMIVAGVKDEALRLPAFLDHHRRLGIVEFHVVDNDSTDDTRDYLTAQSDVSLYHTEQSYGAARCGKEWINEVIGRHGIGRWVLTLDADELFVYPGFESMPIAALCAYLGELGDDAMVALLIDMYSHLPIADVVYSPGASLLDSCPFFDRSSYSEPHEQFLGLPVRGGPRGRLFQFADWPSPFLGKVPLVHWRAETRYPGSTHWLEGFRRADVTGALLHFKYLQDFATRAELESRREEHWNLATEYKSYHERLRQDPQLTFFSDQSERFRGSEQLVELGLMRVPESFRLRLERDRTRRPAAGP